MAALFELFLRAKKRGRTARPKQSEGTPKKLNKKDSVAYKSLNLHFQISKDYV